MKHAATSNVSTPELSRALPPLSEQRLKQLELRMQELCRDPHWVHRQESIATMGVHDTERAECGE